MSMRTAAISLVTAFVLGASGAPGPWVVAGLERAIAAGWLTL